ncbi:L,D-transpeptidase family protein [Martelella soudanensis]|uniref:L,D-transpeptidase family protein n=1 Tax=unclassified Martelella TaxID=2629616 RepID=UPI0015DF01CF|nr:MULTISPECIES: murein L,D-transpeptidase family protein [unclassified Martelella]
MRLTVLAPIMFAAVALTGCNSFFDSTDFSSVQEKMNYSLPSSMVAKMSSRDMAKNAPITIRIFKEEGVLEIWKQKRDGTYGELETYEICAWSGKLGPKKKEGDRQAPEGFYPLSKGLLNPYSQYFLAINTGYPNRYDRANQFTGSDLMIHGACSSRGCYSMTDEQILEIFSLSRDAFAGGQQAIMLQAYPFRMTAENMVRHRHNENYPFWQTLKEGYDYFDVTHKVPDVDVCGGDYVFNKDPVNGGDVASDRACPVMASNIPTQDMMPLATSRTEYQKQFAAALAKNEDKVWIDPSESERKAIVADLRKDPTDALYQPTGSALEAGRYVTVDEYRIAKYGPLETPAEAPVEIDTVTQTAAIPDVPDVPVSSSVPIPEPSPMAAYAEPEPAKKADKPFWKFW